MDEYGELPDYVLGIPLIGDPEVNKYSGDTRTNENAGILAIITLFYRNHNTWAKYFYLTTGLFMASSHGWTMKEYSRRLKKRIKPSFNILLPMKCCQHYLESTLRNTKAIMITVMQEPALNLQISSKSTLISKRYLHST